MYTQDQTVEEIQRLQEENRDLQEKLTAIQYVLAIARQVSHVITIVWHSKYHHQ